MTLLAYNELCELVEQGVIAGVTTDMVNSSSIDLTLGKEIMVELERYSEINLKKRRNILKRQGKLL